MTNNYAELLNVQHCAGRPRCNPIRVDICQRGKVGLHYVVSPEMNELVCEEADALYLTQVDDSVIREHAHESVPEDVVAVLDVFQQVLELTHVVR